MTYSVLVIVKTLFSVRIHEITGFPSSAAAEKAAATLRWNRVRAHVIDKNV
jgi:hypothetical protein